MRKDRKDGDCDRVTGARLKESLVTMFELLQEPGTPAPWTYREYWQAQHSRPTGRQKGFATFTKKELDCLLAKERRTAAGTEREKWLERVDAIIQRESEVPKC